MTTLSIDTERLAATFIRLCETDSPSRREGKMAALLCNYFTKLNADAIEEDDSAEKTGAETGNLTVRFNGSDSSRPPCFSPVIWIRLNREQASG